MPMRATLALALMIACGPTPEEPTSGSSGPTTTEVPDPTSGAPSTSGLTDAPTTGDEEFPRCDPSQGGCSAGVCCSDDPATVGGKTPNFFQSGLEDDEYGRPIFAGDNNELGTWGRCVEVGGFVSPFANGCPVPCNPTWAPARTLEICGAQTSCCPFTELDPAKDCVLDPQTQRWRAVTGRDIPALTPWGDAHTTNQDPTGAGCQQFSAGDADVFNDCIAQLTVADQRGFCYAAGCPCREDLCDMKNPDWVPRCP
jgi:hypothetical protein